MLKRRRHWSTRTVCLRLRRDVGPIRSRWGRRRRSVRRHLPAGWLTSHAVREPITPRGPFPGGLYAVSIRSADHVGDDERRLCGHSPESTASGDRAFDRPDRARNKSWPVHGHRRCASCSTPCPSAVAVGSGEPLRGDASGSVIAGAAELGASDVEPGDSDDHVPVQPIGDVGLEPHQETRRRSIGRHSENRVIVDVRRSLCCPHQTLE